MERQSQNATDAPLAFPRANPLAAPLETLGRPTKVAWVVHPALFSSLFVVETYCRLKSFSSLPELAAVEAVVIALTLAVQFVLWRLFRNAPLASAFLSACVLFFFLFGDVKELFEMWFRPKIMALASATWLLPIWGILFLVVLGLLWRGRRAAGSLGSYLTVLGAILLTANAGRALLARTIQLPQPNALAGRPLALPPNPPDIYFILSDAYTSPESLKRFWDYDDSAFVDFLENRGFQVTPKARSNSTFTPACLSTYLNMDFPPGAATNLTMQGQTAYYGRIIEQAEAPSRLKASGYDVTCLSIFATGGEPRYYCFPKISPPTLATALWNRTVPGFLDAYLTRAGLADVNLAIFQKLPEIAAQRTSKPKFVYAHLMMPHHPYLFDKDGKRIKRGMGINDDHPDLYLNQLIYENGLLTNAIAGILRNSKTPPIIILQGDHGYRSLPGDSRVEESTTILQALLLPGLKKPAVASDHSPVNTFRLVFNRYFGQHYPFLSNAAPTAVVPFVEAATEE